MNKTAKDSMNDTAAKAAAVSFIRRGLARGSRAMTIAPITGRKTIVERYGKLNLSS